MKSLLQLSDNGVQVADEDGFGALLTEVDQSCPGMCLHSRSVVVIQNKQEGWNDLKENKYMYMTSDTHNIMYKYY